MLKPNLDVLPASQQLVWSQLGSTPADFVLYGGTALALRLGHRESVDFDFFSQRTFQAIELLQSIPYLKGQTVTQEDANTLSCNLQAGQDIVRISFFGGLTLRQLEPPDQAEGNSIRVASLIDIFGMKCATIPQRNEVKDYLDIHAILKHGKLTLQQGIAAAKAIYGERYNPILTLQALAFFEDLPQPLSSEAEAELIDAVRSVSLEKLAWPTASSRIGDA